ALAIGMSLQRRDQEVDHTAGHRQEVVHGVRRERDGMQIDGRQPRQLLDGALEVGLGAGDGLGGLALWITGPSGHARAHGGVPSAFWISPMRACSSNGFRRYRPSPARSARSRVVVSSCAVMNTIGID